MNPAYLHTNPFSHVATIGHGPEKPGVCVKELTARDRRALQTHFLAHLRRQIDDRHHLAVGVTFLVADFADAVEQIGHHAIIALRSDIARKAE